MINYLNNNNDIKSDSSILIFAFAGWPDAGQSATNALKTLSENLDAKKFAEIQSEDFFNFSRERPMVYTEDDKRLLKWPSNDFSFVPKIKNNHDLIILNGIEPHLKWNTFGDLIIEFGVQTLDFALTLRNIFTCTAYSGIDPETNLAGTSNVRGLDYFGNPQARSIMFTMIVNI